MSNLNLPSILMGGSKFSHLYPNKKSGKVLVFYKNDRHTIEIDLEQLATIEDSNNVWAIDLDNCRMDKFPKIPRNVVHITCQNIGLNSLDLKMFDKLESLDCSMNSQLTNLQLPTSIMNLRILQTSCSGVDLVSTKLRAIETDLTKLILPKTCTTFVSC